MHDDDFSSIDTDRLGAVTGGGLFGAVRKGWNATRGFREGVGDKVNEFRGLPLKDQATTLAALSTGISAPVAAGATVVNALKK
ncbi:MAG TPA: hypothetical protein VIV11_32500 [Kofleriaceae bacterium]